MADLIKFRVENFAAYGLNKFRNFLVASECDCGCGSSHSRLLLKDKDALFEFMIGMLLEHGCLKGALFAIGYDDHMYAAVMNEDAFVPTKSDVLEYAEAHDEIVTDEELEKYPDDDELEEPIHFFDTNEINMDFFAEIDNAFRCCCYGVLIETKPGEWKIIM